ncbi:MULTISPECIES: DUF350 domain-containing protein [Brevibacillus]|uniref:DUF350 domain-containing protein n=1 Tax=Brevibacillus brevis (strain 47 / JCM 6285 / NBRC 100599) TaxID=358681 RepID=C0ZG60_BREBN|nr:MULTISPECIES: DUF350 domain-containing protein [Bacillales]MBH0333450.1 cell surface protein [Brevibacillus brevis]NRR01348.1 DUF350 domain-containing protein [Brevibacillus sp. RS1.1]NRS49004.1 DUF350 domain-containing protein [Brevibacillus sp. HB2.2]TQR36269.1 DUF350 domain-containing protein [Lysinibacillus sp. SDF0063]UIO40662.1 DUF350 domain-containing protein [Brevibacillus brevis]
MTWTEILGMLVWTGAGGILLFVLMWIDSLFTKYKDITEIKNGNIAVTTRFVMKLFAQGYILSQSIITSNSLWTALLFSVVSFIILFLLERIVEWLLKQVTGLDLEKGTQEGKVAHAMMAGSFHLVGALILAACL